jgi:hypothetical protein
MKILQEAQVTFKAIESLQLTQPKKYNELLEQSKVCELDHEYKLILELSILKWSFRDYLKTLPKDEFKKIRAITTLNKLVRKCFYDLFIDTESYKKEKLEHSHTEQLFVSLIDTLNYLEVNNEQRFSWVYCQLLENSTTLEAEFLSNLSQSGGNANDVLGQFKKKYEINNSYEMAICSLNNFLLLHLGIKDRNGAYDLYDYDITLARWFNSDNNKNHPSLDR